MYTFHFGNRSLHSVGWALSLGLLFAPPAQSQEIIRLPAEDRWLEPEFEEVYRIGSLSAADWEQFGYVRKVAFDGAGRLHVFDMQAANIVVLDQDGGLQHTIGRRGEGPGEFKNALSFAVNPDGQVVVADWGDLAYEIFDAAGDYKRRVRSEPVDGI